MAVLVAWGLTGKGTMYCKCILTLVAHDDQISLSDFVIKWFSPMASMYSGNEKRLPKCLSLMKYEIGLMEDTVEERRVSSLPTWYVHSGM